MNKRKLSWLAALIVTLSFCIVISGSGGVFFLSGAEGNDTPSQQTTASKTHAPEEPYVEPTTTTTTTKPTTTTTTTTTTKPTSTSTTEKKPNSTTESTSKNDVTSSTSTSTTKHEGSEPHEDPSETNPGTTSGTKPSTTKKNNPTTTKKNNTTRYTTAPAATTPKMTIPQVENTEIEGTVLSPLDAYFERMSGDSAAYEGISAVDTTAPEESEEKDNGNSLSMVAIVAICLGGIAVVTCIITAVLALKKKKPVQPGVVEYDDENDFFEYEPDDPTTFDSAPSVDQTSGFTVVSLDDTDYKE